MALLIVGCCQTMGDHTLSGRRTPSPAQPPASPSTTRTTTTTTTLSSPPSTTRADENGILGTRAYHELQSNDSSGRMRSTYTTQPDAPCTVWPTVHAESLLRKTPTSTAPATLVSSSFSKVAENTGISASASFQRSSEDPAPEPPKKASSSSLSRVLSELSPKTSCEVASTSSVEFPKHAVALRRPQTKNNSLMHRAHRHLPIQSTRITAKATPKQSGMAASQPEEGSGHGIPSEASSTDSGMRSPKRPPPPSPPPSTSDSLASSSSITTPHSSSKNKNEAISTENQEATTWHDNATLPAATASSRQRRTSKKQRAPAAASSAGSCSSSQNNDSCPEENHSTGRWTDSEHQAFLRGLHLHGREWKKVASTIPTRTSAQVRSHAQKYFTKMQRDQDAFMVAASTLPPPDPPASSPPPTASPAIQATVARILANPEEVEAEVEETLQRLRERYNQLQQRLEQADRTSQSQQRDIVPPLSRKRPAGPSSNSNQEDQNTTLSSSLNSAADDSAPPTTATPTTNLLQVEELLAVSVLQDALPRSGGSSASEELTMDTNCSSQAEDEKDMEEDKQEEDEEDDSLANASSGSKSKRFKMEDPSL